MRIKTIKIIISLFLIVLFNTLDIKVKAVNNESFYNGEYLSGVYIKKVQGYTSRYETARFIRRSSDGQFSYCLQPFVDFISGKVNIAYDSDYEIVTNMTKEKWERVSLLAYYGYGYGNHIDKKWYIITQMMIWKTVDSSDMYFTNTLNGNRISKYENEMKEIENLISLHYVKPSFDKLNFDISLGETIKLDDKNKAINNYKILNSINVNASISGNELLIKGTNVGVGKLILENKDEKYTSPPIVYVNNTNQDLMVVGSYETITSEVNFNVLAGKIKIIKLDSDTIPSGEALLEGSKYQIINSNNEVIETITIDSNGSAVTNYLPLGTYTIKEIIASKGYYLDNKTYSIEIKENNIYEITLKGEVIKGNIEVTKIDSETRMCKALGEASLEGSVYGIYDYKNNLVDEIIIDNNCKGITKHLPYGRYRVKEISTSTGYNLDNNIYEINIENESINKITSISEVIKGNIEINKIDSETKMCKALGEASLEGSVYGIYDYKNDLVDEIIIDNNCKGISKDLYYGHYKIKELESSIGYNLNKEINKVAIYENDKYLTIFKSDVIKNKIEITKLMGSEDTGFLYLESNAKFNIFNNDKLVKTIVTDNNGFIELNLPYGSYKINQIEGNEYYKLMYPFYIYVNETSLPVQKYYLKNGTISSKLKLINVDNESKQPILVAGTKFKVKNKHTNEYLCQITNKKICEFETDENGVMITSLEIVGGVYILEQIKEPDGYLLSDEKIELEISKENIKEDELYSSIVEVTFKNNQINGSLEIITKGETKDSQYIPLEDITYSVYAQEDIITKDGIIQYLKDELVGIITTNEEGIANIKNLYLGKYYFVENATKDSYFLDENKYYFELNSKDSLKQYEIINYSKRGNLEIKKIDEDSKETLSGVEIAIYSEFGNLIKKEETDYTGIINIDDLLYGKYYIEELNTKENYILNEEKIYFEIDKSLTEIIVNSKKINGYLKLNVVGENNESLENVVFEIYSSNDILINGKLYKKDTLISKLITNNSGTCLSKKIPYGDYYIKQIKINDGYLLEEDEIKFQIRYNNEIVELNINNKKISTEDVIVEKEPTIIEVPDTLSNNFRNIEFAVMVILIYFYGKKKH